MMRKRIMLVDDEPRLLNAVAADLRGEGYDVNTARSAREALIELAQTTPDLIISDVLMPVMDGFALAKRIRGNEATSLIPIIFLTAKTGSVDRIKGFRSGVDAYLTKPFEPDELLAVISAILSRVERTHSRIARLVSTEESQKPREVFYDEELTKAETRVAAAVAHALSNKEIAAEFGVSVRTIEHHIRNILSKKSFSNRVEIALFVAEHSK
ncbi:response regulator transcription factor [soil metagenome]